MYLTAQEAAAALGISRASLYAYVSRGLVRSEPDPQSRSRRYLAADIHSLQQRQEQRRDPGRSAREALFWGAPLLESAVSSIADGRLYYRGRDAVDLAETRTFEEVTALLWTGSEGLLPLSGRLPAPTTSRLPTLQAFHVALARAAAADETAYDLRPEAVQRSGARILRLLGATAAGRAGSRPLADALQRSWVPRQPAARRLLEAALILCADHELNVSAFTVRCVASAGATPYAAVTAGLAALEGVRHGGNTARVEALLDEAGKIRDVVRRRLERGEAVPGFGHPLYPEGDPRGRALLAALSPDVAEAHRSARTRCAGAAVEGGPKTTGRLGGNIVPVWSPRGASLLRTQELVRQVHDLLGLHPTIDLGLVAVRRALGLPSGAALVLFALGRTAGWIAHALEQYQDGRLIRPRARLPGLET